MNRRLHRCNGQQAHAAVFPFTQVSSGGRRRSTHRFTEVRNLFHLASLLDAETASTIWFELDDDDVIALPTELARATTRLRLALSLSLSLSLSRSLSVCELFYSLIPPRQCFFLQVGLGDPPHPRRAQPPGALSACPTTLRTRASEQLLSPVRTKLPTWARRAHVGRTQQCEGPDAADGFDRSSFGCGNNTRGKRRTSTAFQLLHLALSDEARSSKRFGWKSAAPTTGTDTISLISLAQLVVRHAPPWASG